MRKQKFEDISYVIKKLTNKSLDHITNKRIIEKAVSNYRHFDTAFYIFLLQHIFVLYYFYTSLLTNPSQAVSKNTTIYTAITPKANPMVWLAKGVVPERIALRSVLANTI